MKHIQKMGRGVSLFLAALLFVGGGQVQAAGAGIVEKLFVQSGAGAVPVSQLVKLRESVSVKDFGAIGNGSANDTAAMQAAHNTGKLVRYPAGVYSFSTITIAAGGIAGEGGGLSQLISTDATSANLITFTGTGGDTAVPVFRDIKIQAANTKAAGAAISFTPSSGESQYAQVENITTYNVPRGVEFKAASHWRVVNSKFINYSDAGIFVANSFNIDSGDSLIQGNLMNTGLPSGNRFGIYQESSAGLRVLGNKILGGTGGYVLAYKGNTQSGPLLITGNSIENVAGTAIYLGHTATYTGIFGGIVIAGNEIAVSSEGIATDTSGAFTELTIASNYINLNNSTGKHIYLSGASKFLVGSNSFIGGDTAITVTAGSTAGKIGKNVYSGQATATVNNLSTATFVDTDTQSGTVASITHSTAYGPLFYGSVAVTFPTPFTVVPHVICNAGGGAGVAGGFSAYATNVTKTGFTYNIVGVSSGSTATNAWTAKGVI